MLISVFAVSNFIAAAAFVLACCYKIYPVILLPLLFLKRGKKFLFFGAGVFLILFAIFYKEFMNYFPVLLGRFNRYGVFGENITPCGLIYLFYNYYNFNFQPFIYAWYGVWVASMLYVLYIDIINYKNIKDDTFLLNYFISTYMIAVILVPSVIYSYGGVVLIFPLFMTLAKINREKNLSNLDFMMMLGFILAFFNGLAWMKFFDKWELLSLPAQIGSLILFICFVIIRVQMHKKLIKNR